MAVSAEISEETIRPPRNPLSSGSGSRFEAFFQERCCVSTRQLRRALPHPLYERSDRRVYLNSFFSQEYPVVIEVEHEVVLCLGTELVRT